MKHMTASMDANNGDTAFKMVFERCETLFKEKMELENKLKEKNELKNNLTQCEVNIEPLQGPCGPSGPSGPVEIPMSENEKLEIKLINIKQIALQQAVKMNNMDIIKEIVNNDIMSVNKAFQWAIYVSDLAAAEEFIKAGAVAQADDCYAFKLACRAGELEIVAYLIDTYEINIWAYAHIGLSIASCYGYLDIVEYFTEIDSAHLGSFITNALTEAITHGHFDIVMYLLPLRKDTDYSNIPNDYMFLRIACENGHVKLAKYFMEHVNVKYNDALQWGAAFGQLSIVEWVMDIKKCNISDHSKDEYRDALKRAANNGHLNVVKYIVDREVAN